MKEIILTQGKVALVDDEDYERLNKYKWCYHNGYAVAGNPQGGNYWYMQEMVLQRIDGFLIDHINRIRNDNQKSNLRLVTATQNAINQGMKRSNTSGYKGVNLTVTGQWKAQIRIKGKLTYLGQYKFAEDAALAYNNAAQKHHKEFAYINPL